MILDVQNIETYYGESQVLFGPSLSVGEGEVVALLGSNGPSSSLERLLDHREPVGKRQT